MTWFRKVRVFVGAPSDVQEERGAVARVVERLNREVADALSVTVEVLSWDTHSVPGMGRPQARINPLVESCDVFVGILWTRFGMPPGPATGGKSFDSGTEEEFQLALKRWQNGGGNESSLPRILFYFCDRAVPPSRIDAEQMAKVASFKAHFRADGNHPGLIDRYEAVSQFESRLHEHLVHVLFDLAGAAARADVLPDFVSITSGDWDELFANARTADFLFMYSKTWRNTYLNRLREFVAGGGRIRLVLPQPDPVSPSLQLMSERLAISPETLAENIKETAAEFELLRQARPGSVEVRYTGVYFTHTFYLFDVGGFLALYSYLKDRAPSVVIRLRSGPIHRQCCAEFDSLFVP